MFLLKREDAAVRRYGRGIIKQIGGMFERIHKSEEDGGVGRRILQVYRSRDRGDK
jgi:hypothetical protein